MRSRKRRRRRKIMTVQAYAAIRFDRYDKLMREPPQGALRRAL